MDVSKFRNLALGAVGAAALMVASDAAACEDCGSNENGDLTCWSGMMSGWQSCYGGWGEPCYLEGYCDDSSWRDCEGYWGLPDYCGEDDWDCWAWGDCGWSW